MRSENFHVDRITQSSFVTDLARAFPDSAEKRLNGFLVAKVQDLISSYSLKLKLMTDEQASEFESRKGGGGFGGGKDKKGGMGAMLGMAMMMKGTMMAMGEFAHQIQEVSFLNISPLTQVWLLSLLSPAKLS